MSLWKSLTIKQKVVVAIFGGFLYSLFIFMFNYKILSETSENFEAINKNQIRLILLAGDVKDKLSDLQNSFVSNVLSKAIGDGGKDIDIEKLVPAVNNSLNELKKHSEASGNEELRKLSKNLNIRYTAFYSNGVDAVDNSSKENLEESIENVEALNSIADKMNEELANIIFFSRTGLNIATEGFVQKNRDRVIFSLVVGVGAIVIFIVLGFSFARNITSRIAYLINGTNEFSKNNFGFRIKDNCGDELCMLGNSFNSMASSIEELIEQQVRANEMLDQKVKEKTVELQKSLGELEKMNKMVMDSIVYAGKIQNSLLPKHEKMGKHLGEHFVIWNPRDVVGGDFYWMEEVEGGYLLALIDCTGHGVPGSLMTMVAVPTLDRIVNEYDVTEPSVILQMLNRMLKKMLTQDSELSDDGLEAGVCFVDTKNNKVVFSGARIPLFYVQNGEIEEIKGDKHGIGYKNTPDEYEFTRHEVLTQSGTSFYMTSDGLIEQVGGEEKRMVFGKKRFKEMIKDIHVKSKIEQKHLIMETISNYKGDESQRDDMTCIGFKIS